MWEPTSNQRVTEVKTEDRKIDNQATTKGSYTKGPTRHVLEENSTFNNALTADCMSYCY